MLITTAPVIIIINIIIIIIQVLALITIYLVHKSYDDALYK